MAIRLLISLFLVSSLVGCSGFGAGSPGPAGSPFSSFSSGNSGGSTAGSEDSKTAPDPTVASSTNPPAPNGTLGAPVESGNVHGVEFMTLFIGTPPNSDHPGLTPGIVRRITWDENTPEASQWTHLNAPTLTAMLEFNEITWAQVQDATWREFSVTLDSVGMIQTDPAVLTDGVTGPMVFVWRPSNATPVLTDQKFTSMDEFLQLFNTDKFKPVGNDLAK